MEISYSKTLSLYTSADVFVAGGGPSGIAAAVSAARLGKRVVLVEQTGVLGGASILCMVAEFMTFDDGENFLSGGIGREVFDKFSFSHVYNRISYGIRYEELKRVYDELVLDAGVEVMFYTKIVDVIAEDGLVKYAVLSTPSGLQTVEAKMFIDCTGSGILADFAGAEYGYGDENGNTMSATICTLWGGVDFERKLPGDGRHIDKAYKDGVFSQYDTLLPGIRRTYKDIGVGFGNVGHCFKVDDRDVKSLTNAMFEGRKILPEYETYYRGYLEGCENATIIKSADFIGIRESRRITCEYTLTGETFFSDTPFTDEIGRYSYPIDMHPITADKKGMDSFQKHISMRHERGQSYSIPYRSLVPKGIKNVLVAGKCIGADHTMQATIRVIPCCYITGQAAGVAASVCVDNNTTAANADVKEIQNLLKQAGAYLKR